MPLMVNPVSLPVGRLRPAIVSPGAVGVGEFVRVVNG